MHDNLYLKPLTQVAKAALTWVIVSFTGLAYPANQLPEADSAPDLSKLSIESLLDLDLRSVMKSSTGAKNASAALFILTADDIRRSGATTLPEVLRLVPGISVSRIDGNKWAVAIRGFNNQFSNKLLVLRDGRSLYTPVFSGVWWDQEDVLLEDIERIEVIRGPGASLWGANAVNGVINIVSKKLTDSQKALVSAHGGSMRKGGGIRYGADLGNQAYLKVFGGYREYDASTLNGHSDDAGDDGRLSKLGMQFDKAWLGDKLSLQGEVFSGWSGGANQVSPRVSSFNQPALAPPYWYEQETDLGLSGHYLMARWQHQFNDDSSTILRAYWNRNERKSSAIGAHYRIDTVDLDFQHNYRWFERHQIVWGLGARLNFNNTDNSPYLGWLPNKRQDEIYSFFVHDEITLLPERWKLTLGNKLEHNPVTHDEWQPTIRLAFTPNDQHTFWASVSRAVRTPNWTEQDITYNASIVTPFGNVAASPFTPVILVNAVGNKQQVSEKLIAYEVGWRAQLTPSLTSDIAFYYYDYDDVAGTSLGALDFSTLYSGYLIQPVTFSNAGQASIVGGEAFLDWRASDDWRLRASYSLAQQHFTGNQPGQTTIMFAGSVPTHQAMLNATYQLRPDTMLDLNWRYVDSVNVEGDSVPAYHELDARLAWQVNRSIELSLVGKNLLHEHHLEYGKVFFSVPTLVQREVYATIRWEF